MRALAIAIGISLMATAQAGAAESRFERSLRHLAPSARMEQICDFTAMKRIRASDDYRPDRAVGYGISPGKVRGNTLHADGAAFRSRGKWYRLSYLCTTTPDRMKVLSFTFTIGPEIPQEKWARYGLWK